MKKLHFSVIIQAPREQVWNTMLDPQAYRMWTTPFCEGSYFEGSWRRGERIRFLAPNGSGMTSEIAENRLHEYLSIKHLGLINEGVEDMESEQVRSWAPAFENYTLVSVGAATEVRIDLDVTLEFEQYMLDTWPKALAALRAICESNSSG